MAILPYKLDTTNDLLTSRAGLLSIAQLINSLKLSENIDRHFPLPKSNRGFLPPEFIQTLALIQHEGRFHLFHLDDVRNIQEDTALELLLVFQSFVVKLVLTWWQCCRFRRVLAQMVWLGLMAVTLISRFRRRAYLPVVVIRYLLMKSDTTWALVMKLNLLGYQVAHALNLTSPVFRVVTVTPVQVGVLLCRV